MSRNRNIELKGILCVQLLLIGALIALTFVTFHQNESGDLNAAIFGTLLYAPYTLLISVYNVFLILFVQWVIPKAKIIAYLLPAFLPLVWFFFSPQPVKIRHWNFCEKEFLVLSFTIAFTNAIGYWNFKKIKQTY